MKLKLSASWTLVSIVSCFIIALSAYPARPKRGADNFWKCSSKTKYVSGFSTFSPEGGVACVGRPAAFYGQTTQCSWLPTHTRNYYSWNECPSGYFYQGFGYREMLCCKPSSHPRSYSVCYNLSIKDQNRTAQCSQDHFVAGSQDRLSGNAIDTSTVRCCKMFSSIIVSDVDVVDQIKDETQVPLSLLADWLGYAWCAGCRGHVVGDNFIPTSTGWTADTSGACPGYRSNERLGIDYAGWKILQSNVTYGEIEVSQPESTGISKGVLINNLTSDIMHHLSKTITKRTTVTHTKLSSFTFTHTVSSSFSVSFKNFKARFGYKFSYETTEENFDGEENEDTATDKTAVDFPIKACSTLEYYIIPIRATSTLYYTSNMRMIFTAALKGFLRQGGGQDSNYHERYRDSSERPIVSYEFGSENITFCDDLKKKSDNSASPWKWRDMISRYDPQATTVLQLLTDPSRYQFQLKGKFEGVESTSFYFGIKELEPPAGCNTQDNTTKGQQGAARNKRQALSPDDMDDGAGNSSAEAETHFNNKTSLDDTEDDRGKIKWKKFDVKSGKWSDVDNPPVINVDDKKVEADEKQDKVEDVYLISDRN
ncbi:hypothetical protein BsWGS_10124 [Bradybaena similaris]